MSQTNRPNLNNALLQRLQRYSALATLFRSEASVVQPGTTGNTLSATGAAALVTQAPIAVTGQETAPPDNTGLTITTQTAAPTNTTVPAPGELSDDRLLQQIARWHHPTGDTQRQAAEDSIKATTSGSITGRLSPPIPETGVESAVPVGRSEDQILGEIMAWHREPESGKETVTSIPEPPSSSPAQPAASPKLDSSPPASVSIEGTPGPEANRLGDVTADGAENPASHPPEAAISQPLAPASPPSIDSQQQPVKPDSPSLSAASQADSLTPLQDTGWQVTRLDSAPLPPEAQAALEAEPGLTETEAEPAAVQERVTNEAIETAVARVAPGQPTSAAIEFIPPRRRHETGLPPDPMPPQLNKDSLPTDTDTAAGESKHPAMVATEIGPLPADLWPLIGQEVPTASAIEPPASSDHLPQLEQEEESLDAAALPTKPPPPGVTPRIDTLPAPDSEKQTQIMRWAVDKPVHSESEPITPAEEPVTVDSPADSSAVSAQPVFDTDQIAHLVLEDIWQRYAVELERLL